MRWIIAYSGGVDSHVLLHLASQQAQALNKKILAVHINHGLHADADQWQGHCEKVCKQLGVEFVSVKVKINQENGDSVEAAAREARYAALAEFVEEGDVLLTAQHQDDQAETVLLQLFRGAGVKGLAAMPQVSRFADGYIVRPLLETSRNEILAYAREHQLQWIDDPSNENQRFDRNFLRQTILPQLQQRWPALKNVLARTARHCADADVLLMKQGREDYRLAEKLKPLNLPAFLKTGIIARLSIPALLALPYVRQVNALRAWLYDLRAAHERPLQISENVLQHIIHDIILSKHDAAPLIEIDNFEIRRFDDELYVCEQLEKFDTNKIYAWNLRQNLVLPIGTLTPDLVAGVKQGMSRSFIIRFRQGGERFHPQGRAHSQTLKKLFQEWRIPPWLRDRIPLLYSNNVLIEVFFD